VPGDTATGDTGSSTSIGDQAATAVLQTTSKAQASAGKVADQARQLIVKQLNTQKDRVTGSLESLINVLRQSGQQLEDQGQAPVASLANRAADGVEQVWIYLSDRDVVALEREGEGFARTQPAIFLSGAFALGFLGARFFRSSRQAAQTGTNLPAPYNQQYAAAQAEQDYTVPPLAATGTGTSSTQPGTYGAGTSVAPSGSSGTVTPSTQPAAHADTGVNAPYTRPSTAPATPAPTR
jgi:hypothetical protein